MEARKLTVFCVAVIAASAACGDGGQGSTPKASAISLLSGNGQTGKPGAALADLLVVQVTDASGAPSSGFQVSWSSTTGTVGSSLTQTTANGTASISATLGSTAGSHTFTATAAGLAGSPVTFTATAAAPLSCSPASCGTAPLIVASPTPACGRLDPCPTARPTTTCTKSVVPGPAGLVHHDVHTVGQVVSFLVPTGTASLTIVEQAIVAPATVVLNGNITLDNVAVPDKLRDPLGTIVYDDNPPSPLPADPSGLLAFFASDSPVTGSFTIPNTSPMLLRSAQGLSTGNWQFIVNDYGFECVNASNCSGGSNTSTYDVSVLLKPGAAAPGSGALDVAFYLVGTRLADGTTPLLASDAPNDPGVKRMIATLAGIYAGAGICLRTVTFYDVPAWAQDAYGVLNADNNSPCDDLDQMFTLSVPGNQLNLFLVGSLVAVSQGGATVVGVDGAIPGPSAFGSTVHSGAAVNGSDLESIASCTSALDFLNCGPDSVAYIAAHEGGHWLGLYHTTELDGEDFDPLADTAKCPCEICAPASARVDCNNGDLSVRTTMDGSSCTASAICGGGDNLMFWVLGDRSLGTITCEQSSVMRANPAVQ